MIPPLEEGVDHVRGPADAPVIVEYGDYECPFSRQAYRAIQRVEAERTGGVRFAFRHFPLTEIHPHALAASGAAEAAEAVFDRVERDFRSGIESGEVQGTPTLFIDGVVHLGGYDAETLLDVLAS